MSEDSDIKDSFEGVVVSPSGNRRRSSSKMPGIIKRAASSPNVGSLTIAENMNMSAADKKRNKLGYHRTAVACGHCRRRKIRCIPAFEDTSGRCQNCIRLKKECHFFPVDQQTPTSGKRAPAPSNADGMGDLEHSVSSSSPRILGNSSTDQLDRVNGQTDTPPLPQDHPGFPGYLGSAPTHGYPHPREFGYPPGYDGTAHTMTPFVGQSPQSFTGERASFDPTASSFYQSPDHRSLQSSFTTSPYTSALSSSSMTAPSIEGTYHYPPHGAHEYQWQPPSLGRSMSISDSEDLAHHYGMAYRTNTYPSFERRMSSANDGSHLPPINSHISPITSGTPQSAISGNSLHDSHHFHPVPSQLPSGWPTGHPSHMAHMAVSGAERYGMWHPTAPGLREVREDEDSPPILASQGSIGSHRFRPNPG